LLNEGLTEKSDLSNTTDSVKLKINKLDQRIDALDGLRRASSTFNVNRAAQGRRFCEMCVELAPFFCASIPRLAEALSARNSKNAAFRNILFRANIPFRVLRRLLRRRAAFRSETIAVARNLRHGAHLCEF
jgi:hypothetical protein